jgi:hypothetical protein
MMVKMHTVEVRFLGEKVATHTEGEGEGADVYTLYRTEELYRVHIDEGEGGPAWLEGGHLGNGLTEAQLLRVFPEFEGATTRAFRHERDQGRR